MIHSFPIDESPVQNNVDFSVKQFSDVDVPLKCLELFSARGQ